MKLFNQKGDTIVEVLIAISVLAFAIGTGYATVNKSNQAILANKERYQAQLVATQQVEYLRKFINQSPTNVRPEAGDGSASHKCIKPDPLDTAKVKFFSVSPPDNNQCDMPSSLYGATYIIKTNFVGVCDPTSIYCDYKVEVSWDGVNSSKERLEVYYGL